jgi:hypothetical protein
MASTGFARSSKPSQALIGPLLTQSGFQYWYLVCTQDCMIAVRQKIWAGLLLAASNSLAPVHMGVLGYLLRKLLPAQARKYRQKLEIEIPRIPGSRLRSMPNMVFDTVQLNSITLKPKKFGGLGRPDIILEMRDGKTQKFGIEKVDYGKAVEQLQLMYPGLCKTV